LRFANKQSEIILIYFDRRKGTWTIDLFLTGCIWDLAHMWWTKNRTLYW